jgi:hypothetical protein
MHGPCRSSAPPRNACSRIACWVAPAPGALLATVCCVTGCLVCCLPLTCLLLVVAICPPFDHCLQRLPAAAGAGYDLLAGTGPCPLFRSGRYWPLSAVWYWSALALVRCLVLVGTGRYWPLFTVWYWSVLALVCCLVLGGTGPRPLFDTGWYSYAGWYWLVLALVRCWYWRGQLCRRRPGCCPALATGQIARTRSARCALRFSPSARARGGPCTIMLQGSSLTRATNDTLQA